MSYPFALVLEGGVKFMKYFKGSETYKNLGTPGIENADIRGHPL
jgi:hypothetical protein